MADKSQGVRRDNAMDDNEKHGLVSALSVIEGDMLRRSSRSTKSISMVLDRYLRHDGDAVILVRIAKVDTTQSSLATTETLIVTNILWSKYGEELCFCKNVHFVRKMHCNLGCVGRLPTNRSRVFDGFWRYFIYSLGTFRLKS